jgi:hypothetical protein
MKIDKELIENDLHIRYSFDDFEFVPYLDILKVNFLHKYLLKQPKRSKAIMNLINYYKKLNKLDSLLPDELYKDFLSKINYEKDKNKVINITTYKKNNRMYFVYKTTKYFLTIENYYRIKNRFLLNDNLNDYIFCILNRYNLLELLNGLSGSIHKDHYKKLNKYYNAKLEGFSSFYNSNLKYYCGLFPDLEKHFGCIANIFNICIQKGFVVFNPPFNVKFMNDFFSFITDKKHQGTFLFIIPAFKIKDRIELNKICKLKQNTNYKDDYDIDILRLNSNLVLDYLYCKNNFVYYDFLTNKNISYTSTNIILLKNKNNNIFDKNYIKTIFGEPNIILIN